MQSHLSCAHSQVDAGPVETGDQPMFIAMNRFRVKKGSEQAFEKVWLSRDTQLTKVPGFVECHLLKGPEHARSIPPHRLAKQGSVRSLDKVEGIPRRPQGCGPEQAALHGPSRIRGLRGAPDCASGQGCGRLAPERRRTARRGS